jgi:tRNA threonylcarbamoyladenosine biosynthesis protein TsaB
MKKYLAIDTSSAYLTVIAKGGKTSVRYLPDCAGSHSVKLLSEVEAALAEAGSSVDDCDFFAVVAGAGSFTGIRIGIATIKGFCTGTGKPALPVTSFEVIAYTTGEVKTLAIISAGHGYVYLCGLNERKEVVLPPAYKSIEEAIALSAEYDVVAGFEELPISGMVRVNMAEGLQKAVEAKSLLSENLVPCEEVRAVYVRKSQAEESKK